MTGADNEQFKLELKKFIVETCKKDDVEPGTITDDEPIFGPDSTLGLDSLDVLEITVALKLHYGLQITDSKEAIKVMKSINTLAEAIQSKRSA